MSHRGLPHTAVRDQIPELLAESSIVSQTWCLLAGTLCWDSVALGAGVGLLVGGLFPGMAGCRAGVTLVTVVCLLVCGSGSWVLIQTVILKLRRKFLKLVSGTDCMVSSARGAAR